MWLLLVIGCAMPGSITIDFEAKASEDSEPPPDVDDSAPCVSGLDGVPEDVSVVPETVYSYFVHGCTDAVTIDCGGRVDMFVALSSSAFHGEGELSVSVEDTFETSQVCTLDAEPGPTYAMTVHLE